MRISGPSDIRLSDVEKRKEFHLDEKGWRNDCYILDILACLLPSLFCDFDFAFLGAPHIFEWCASQTHNGRAAKALFFPPTDSQSSSMFFFYFFSFSFSFFGGLRGFLDVQDSFLSFLLLFYFSFLEIYTVDLE